MHFRDRDKSDCGRVEEYGLARPFVGLKPQRLAFRRDRFHPGPDFGGALREREVREVGRRRDTRPVPFVELRTDRVETLPRRNPDLPVLAVQLGGSPCRVFRDSLKNRIRNRAG